MPNTGTVHAEYSFVVSDADLCPRPKKYCVPSVVVTFQYSPSLSPLNPPVSFSTLVASSCFGRHAPVALSLISSTADPPNIIVALSESQHRSPLGCDALFAALPSTAPSSSTHGTYRRSMYPGHMSQPSPIHDDWLFVDATRPSSDADEYPNASSGDGPAGAGGTRIGYDHVNAPVLPDTFHAADGDNDVADQSPDDPATSAARAISVEDGEASVAVKVCAPASFACTATGTPVPQSASSGELSAHSGSSTSRSRSDHPPPNASAIGA